MANAVKLVVSAEDHSQVSTQTLPAGQTLRIGRAPQNGWAIPWGAQISREHADLVWDGESLHVTCLEQARNPLLLAAMAYRELTVTVGQQFRIGTTVFSVLESEDLPIAGDASARGATPASDIVVKKRAKSLDDFIEHTFSAQELAQFEFGHPGEQMEILANLPSLISSSQSDEDLAQLLVGLLLSAIPQADCVAVASFDEQALDATVETGGALPDPKMMRVETREGFVGRFRPSRRLILKSLQDQASVIHEWIGEGEGEEFTMSEGLGWAFCAPIQGESCRGWCLYVSGQSAEMGSAADAMKGDLRFSELVAQFIGSVRQVRLLQEHKTQLSTFFSPNVIKNLTARGAGDVLTPAERDVTVLFCDVRGFSRKSEQMSHDLHLLLQNVRAALGVMSHGILDHDGTIADFQGDAALGFWGWPGELETGPIPACRAALDIYRGFRAGGQDESSLLHGFSVGIGIVHGRAIAGQIGTANQAKVGVFGPVVNQGARLEGMTKQFGVAICIDEVAADWVQRLLDPSQARVRRLARVRPKGMDVALTIFELLPPAADEDTISDQTIADYEAALEAVIAGRWQEAVPRLNSIPGPGPQHFLLKRMAEQDNVPPADWDGVFSLTSK